MPPPARGELILEASVTDPAGSQARTLTEVWVSGEDSGFDSAPSNRIDLVPEKPTYAPGETARFQVRMPFREATALVTIEREGIGEARVVHLTAESPVLEVAIRDEYAPNVFVSALLVRGRVSDVQPTALVDLGRPAYKLGIAEITVEANGHRLDVAVTSDRDVYRVRDTARVQKFGGRRARKAAAPSAKSGPVKAASQAARAMAWARAASTAGVHGWARQASVALMPAIDVGDCRASSCARAVAAAASSAGSNTASNGAAWIVWVWFRQNGV